MSYFDRRLSEILTGGRFDQAVIAVTADHGELFGDHGVWFSHGSMYPGTLAVPLVITWQGAPGDRHVTEPVSHLDLGRTLLDLAGLGGAAFDGEALTRAEPGRSVRFGLSGHRHSASIRGGRWFLVLHLREYAIRAAGQRFARHDCELFDVSVDPRCLNEVSSAEPDVSRNLRARLVRWLGSGSGLRSTSAAALETDRLAHLAALGYATDLSADAGEELFDPACDCEPCRRYAD